MNARAAALVLLFASSAAFGCSRSHGPFGFSRHPYTTSQIERLLAGFPNPGPNPESIVRDASGHEVAPPRDKSAYASELVAFVPGRPSAIVEGSNPRQALGLPNYTASQREMPKAVSLGNGGSITLRLVGDPLLDVEGPDLFVFESGPSIEAVSVEISADGETWTSVGDAPGGGSAVDIAPFVKQGETFRFVRLTDVPNSGVDNDVWPGAEIDAVAAIRGWPVPAVIVAEKPAERISISTEVLFGFDSDALAPGAPAELDRVVERMTERPNLHLAIEGHTDDVGEDDYNLSLSQRRAQAVKAYLTGHGVAAARVEAHGFGESRPATANDSDAGRRKNRRVELVLSERP